MKIVIIMLNSKFIHSSLAPWYLAEGAKAACDKCIDIKVIEASVNEGYDSIYNQLSKAEADAYAFCSYIWNIKLVLALAEELKKALNSTIVLGGPEVSYNAFEILSRHKFIDYILCGDGETSFAQLCSFLNDNTRASNIDGLCKRDGEKIITSPPVVCDKEPPSPYSAEYFECLNGRIAYIEASRGCPFSCAFCLSGRKNKLILFSLDRIKADIAKLVESGTKTIKFIDRTFNADKERAEEIIKFIITSFGTKSGLCFHFEIDGGSLQDSTIKLLQTAPLGLFQLEIGLQTYNCSSLSAIHRKTDTAKLEAAIKKLLANGNIHIHADLIAGLPLEDYESFKQSFNRLFALRPHMLQLGFLKLLHGSELRDKSTEYGYAFNESPPYEVISNFCISHDELCRLHSVESMLDRLYNSQRFSRSLNYLINDCGLDAFDMLLEFAEFCENKASKSLDELLLLFYQYFSNKSDKLKLRDLLLCDRISSNSSNIIPEVLKIEDKRIKQIKKYLKENIKIKGRFSCAILYTESKAVYCSYTNKNPVTGQYELNYLDINQF